MIENDIINIEIHYKGQIYQSFYEENEACFSAIDDIMDMGGEIISSEFAVEYSSHIYFILELLKLVDSNSKIKKFIEHLRDDQKLELQICPPENLPEGLEPFAETLTIYKRDENSEIVEDLEIFTEGIYNGIQILSNMGFGVPNEELNKVAIKTSGKNKKGTYGDLIIKFFDGADSGKTKIPVLKDQVPTELIDMYKLEGAKIEYPNGNLLYAHPDNISSITFVK
jgi:hypothetical protein